MIPFSIGGTVGTRKIKISVVRRAWWKLNPMATRRGPGVASRICRSVRATRWLRDSLGENHELVQAADVDEAMRVIAEGGADVVLLSTAVSDPEAVRALGQLLTALADKRT